MVLRKTVCCIVGAASILISGCVSDPYHQGNYVNMSELKPNVNKWTKEDVEKTFGSPSFVDPKNKNVAYYIGALGVKKPLMSPSIEKSSSVRVEYNANGKLIKVSDINIQQKN